VLLVLALLMAACGTGGTGGTAPTSAPTASGSTAATAAPTAASDAAPTASGGAAATAPATADDKSLETVKQRGKLIVGVKYDVQLFGFLNPETNKVEGFDVEMARAVAQRIFGNPDAIEFKEAVSKNRIPYLDEGVVDVVFSTMTANEERAKQIEFSDCYYVAGQSLLVPASSSIASVKDLAGKAVGTAKGSTSEKNIRAAAPDAKIELFDSYSEAVQAMQSGRVDAVTTDDIILYGFQKLNTDKFKVVGGQFTQEPYAAGVKKGNIALLNEVNAALRDLKQSGKWAELYKTWISSTEVPVPPQDWREVGKK
jgi:putative glutamine transport system substrate-binding protein